jgi:hypothetical protein
MKAKREGGCTEPHFLDVQVFIVGAMGNPDHNVKVNLSLSLTK